MEADLHGVGTVNASSSAFEAVADTLGVSAGVFLERETSERGIWNGCFFSGVGVSSVSEEGTDLASPSQISISIQRHP